MKSDEYTFTNNLPEYELKVDLAKIRESLSFKDNPIEDIRSFKSSSIQSVNELVSVLKIVLSDIEDAPKEIKEKISRELAKADTLIIQGFPCDSCFIGDQSESMTKWRRKCANGHCWCPTCIL